MTFTTKTVTLRPRDDRAASHQRQSTCLVFAAMAANGFKRRFHGDDSGQRDTGQLLFAAEVWKRIGFALDIAPRELDVVRQVFDARSEAAIARELGLSPHTVHTYLGRVYRKLNVTNRVQLVVRVVAQHQVLASVPPKFDRRKQTIRGRSLSASPG